MKLPNGNNAQIPRSKLLNYILSETHSTGKFKARFFRNLGFTISNVDLFENALRELVRTEEVKETITTPFGTKFVVEGRLLSPIGKVPQVRTVWILEKGTKNPRLVTVYPV